jgi:hypothetical protein
MHEGYGATISDEVPGTKFLNASIGNASYVPENAPFQVEMAVSL